MDHDEKNYMTHNFSQMCLFQQSSESQYESNEWLNVMHAYFRQTIEFQSF